MRKVTFQRRVNSKDDYGQTSTTWQDLYSVGAKVSQLNFKEADGRTVEVASSSLQLTIPYSQRALNLRSLDSAMLSGIRYSIENVDFESGFRKEVRVICTQYNEV